MTRSIFWGGRRRSRRDATVAAGAAGTMFSFDNVAFRYDPYPIGLAKPLIEEGFYRALVDTYPPLEHFKFMPKFGNKYVLSEKFNGDRYERFISDTPVWKKLHGWIKSADFIAQVVGMLEQNAIDLDLRLDAGTTRRRLKVAWRDFKRGRLPLREPALYTRFEFSMLPADGGYIVPHTDNRDKHITLVVSMLRDKEWDPAFGGGTDVNRPKDIRRNYNRINRQLKFDEVEVLDTFEFSPNQAVIFVKTFNSLHSVRPMHGHGSKAMRQTLTINIESDG